MKKIFAILLFCLALAFLMLFSSCGAAKSDKTKTNEEVKTENSNNYTSDKKEESNVKKTENTIIDDKNETVIEETNYEPIDNTKPASIIDPDGKETKLNNSKKTTRKTTKKNNTKTDNSKKSEEFHKSELSEQSESKGKTEGKKAGLAVKRERSAWSMWNLLWLLIPVGIYLVWKKYSDKIWWI